MTPSAAVILAVLPLAVFGTVAIVPPQSVPTGRNDGPFVPTIAVRTEGITARRIDDATFRRRWPTDLPPPVIIRTVQTVPAPAAVEPAATVRPPPARIVKRASLRLDICARHGLRRVDYLKRGYKAWRCQRR